MNLPQYFFISEFILLTLLLLGVIVAVFLVDLKILKFSTKIKPKSIRQKVTIVIYAYNHSSTITQSLRSALSLQTKRIEVVVVDNNSVDNTAHLIKELAVDRQLKTLFKRKRATKQAALRQVLKKCSPSDLTLVMQGDQLVSKDSLKHAIAVLNKNKQAKQSFIAIPIAQGTLLSNVSVLLNCVTLLTYKAALSFKKEVLTSQSSVVLYKTDSLYTAIAERETFTKASFIAPFRSLLAGNFQGVTVSGVRSLVVSLNVLVVVAYFLNIAFRYERPELLVYTFLTFVVWSVLSILATNGMSKKEKANIVFVVPTAATVLYLVNFYSILRAVYTPFSKLLHSS